MSLSKEQRWWEKGVLRWLGSGYSVLSLQSKKRKSRFSLLQLEHGEMYLIDYGVVLKESSSQKEEEGRLKLCSRSLVFEPSDMRMPLKKFSFCYFEDGIELVYTNEIRFKCTKVVEMSGSVPQPYSSVSGFSEFSICPQHSSVIELHRTAECLRRYSFSKKHGRTSIGAKDEEEAFQALIAPLRIAKFELRKLVDFTEDIVLQVPAERVTPLLKQPGLAVITTQRIYFEPAPLNDEGDARLVSEFESIAACRKARHMMEHRALEILIGCASATKKSTKTQHQSSSSHNPLQKDCLRLAFSDSVMRDQCFNALKKLLPSGKCFDASSSQSLLQYATQSWQRRDLDNFTYLALLNFLADRSLHDLSQYPVFPWVLADYRSHDLVLTKENQTTYRDLSKPIGALDKKRLDEFRDRFDAVNSSANLDLFSPPTDVSTPKSGTKASVGLRNVRNFVTDRLFRSSHTSACTEADTTHDDIDDTFSVRSSTTTDATQEPDPRDKPFLYGTHYSTPGYVAFYLVRAAPEYTLCLQNGRFDAPDRMFISIERAYRSVLANTTDLKELIPEFYDGDGSFLLNARRVPLGTTQAGDVVADVELPAWARSSPQLLVTKLRAALESDYVSHHLPAWIDLIFGSSQEHPDNLFHPLTYEHNVATLRKTVAQRDLLALETQIDEFGQTPSRIFDQPHPPRGGASISTSRSSSYQEKQHIKEAIPPAKATALSAGRSQARRSPLEAVGVSPLDASKLLSAKAPPDKPISAPIEKQPIGRPSTTEVVKPRKLPTPPPTITTTTNKKSDWTQLSSAPRIRSLRAVEKSLTRAHRDAVTGVACEANIVASSSRDGTVKLSTCLHSDSARSQQRWFVPRRTLASPARAPLTCVCLTHDARYTLTAGADARLFIFIVDSGRLLTTVDNCHDAPVTALTCCRGSTSASYEIATAGLDACVKLWHFAHDEISLSLELYDHETPVSSVALRAFTHIVAAGAEDGQLLIWDARETSGSVLGRAKLGDNPVCAVAIVGAGPNGDTVFAADTCGLLLQLSLHGQQLARFNLRNDIAHIVAIDARKAPPNPLESSPSTPNGPFIFVAVGDGDLVLLDWSHRTPTVLTKRKAHVSAIAALALVKSCWSSTDSKSASSSSDSQGDNFPDALELHSSSASTNDLLEIALISAAEDCTLKAWEIVRHQEEEGNGAENRRSSIAEDEY